MGGCSRFVTGSLVGLEDVVPGAGVAAVTDCTQKVFWAPSVVCWDRVWIG